MNVVQGTMWRSLILPLAVLLAPTIAFAADVIVTRPANYEALAVGAPFNNPINGDDPAIGGGAHYTFEAHSPGNQVMWYCDITKGYFGTDSNPTQTAIGDTVRYTPKVPCQVWIGCRAITDPPDQSPLCLIPLNQYVLILVPDDDYSTSQSPPEPEMDGLRDFVVPKDKSINVRFTLQGPAGTIPLQFRQVTHSTGSLAYPSTQSISHDGNPNTVYTVVQTVGSQQWRVLGLTTSYGKSDTEFRLCICDSGYPEAASTNPPNDTIASIAHCTIVEIEKVLPNQDNITDDFGEPGTPTARVLINKASSDSSSAFHNPSGYDLQSEVREAKITARLTPWVSGVTLWLKTYDLDDPSPYEKNTDGTQNTTPDDNQDPDRKGELLVEYGVQCVANTETIESGKIVAGAFRASNAAGDVKVRLRVTNRCAGDNYEVRAGFTPELLDSMPATVTKERTCQIVAWKKHYYEVHKMIKPNGFAETTQALVPDENSSPDIVELTDVSGFQVGDWVRTLEYATGDSDLAKVVYVHTSPNYLSLKVPFPGEEGAWWDLQCALTAGASAVYTVDSSGDYYEADTSALEVMLKDAFVEYATFPNLTNDGVVPVFVPWIANAPITAFVDSNFDSGNKSARYSFWLSGAIYGPFSDTEPGTRLGGKAFGASRSSFVFGKTATRMAETTCHEVGHTACSTFTAHCTGDSHKSNVGGGSSWCVMWKIITGDVGTRMQDDDHAHHIMNIRRSVSLGE